MHRSGTSAIASGLRALSVYLGDNFFDPQPDNPTGYWEDKTIVHISQRVLEELRLKWDDTSLIAPDRFHHHRIRLLKLKAVHYLKTAFGSQPLWGFKDPRTIRLLPFWLAAVHDFGAADAYVLAIRNPSSVVASLFRRQEIKEEKARRLWLVHTVPFLHELRDKPLVVVDYDLLMLEPSAQLERIAGKLGLSLDDADRRRIDRFGTDFLDASLRHSTFSLGDLSDDTDLARLTRDAYRLLHGLATDKLPAATTSFWPAWERIADELETVVQGA
jgi:O-antigen biosynthesis protein